MKATNQIQEKLKIYIEKNFQDNLWYEQEETNQPIERAYIQKAKYNKASTININEYLNQTLDKKNFQTTLFNFIDKTDKKDSEIYNKAYIDRRLFSKIRSDSTYHPSKNTVISLGIALELNINEFEELLNSASYSLPKNNYFDLIIRFCIEEKIYNIIEINNYLNQYHCHNLL